MPIKLQDLCQHTKEKVKILFKIFLGSGYSKNFQLTLMLSKLGFRDLKGKIDK